jgi:hypothetical protein
MIGQLELQLIYRLGELIKGIGAALMNYAAKKKEQSPADKLKG